MALSFAVMAAGPAANREAEIVPSGSPDNALDVAEGSAIDLGDLGNLHAVPYQGADARELGSRHRTGAGFTLSGQTENI